MAAFQSQGRGGGRMNQAQSRPPLFDPNKPLDQLVDKLAEEQANMMPEGRDALKSSQLRRFFGDIKELYRRLNQKADYERDIAPMFKMMRSKAAYSWRNGDRGQSKIPREFHDFIDQGVAKVTNEEQFRKFVQHFEAVVGFLYGSGKVGK